MTPARRAPDSFDAYWAEVSSTATETIRGVTVRVPFDIPMAMEQRLADLQESAREEDLAELVSLLFDIGPDAFATWKQAGMGATEFQVVLAWGMAHADGQAMTWAEAHALVLRATSEGKAQAAPNRAARRASSASTGGRSKATSARGTGSARKTLRA
ncbi:hypothetical protein OOK31_25580 [Streptomyces sp. NBC_00249]|uniref:hypothetical protein n=1 Tax=Streptomyces sp. NBC_00249 TaxID=2975690 RepID=UPI00225673F0|nr:hypothetical protein [Streptomyces sp. NBC_00249]MCX5197229.1 hypothetical protein [Streptomyces sp. NBC_00249]